MLQELEQPALSEYASIYDRLIPRDHFLRKINELIDFSFIVDELREKYCLVDGRNAFSPILLFKYLLLKVIYNLSDRDLVERSLYDMSFKYFLGLRPEDDVIHPTTLSKFRKLRLKDENLLDLLIRKSVQIAIEKGIIKSKTIIVDATHTRARYNNKSPYAILIEQAKLLRKTVYHCSNQDWKKLFPKKVENGLFEDAMDYCRDLISFISSQPALCEFPAIREKMNMLQEIVDDNAEHLAESKDTDARVGHKTAETSFFGYKTHIAMTDERIITAATITSGEKNDCDQLPALIEKSRENGIEVATVIGDTAYSSKGNLALAESTDNPEKKFVFVSKLNPVISNSINNAERNGFIYNKDADLYVCPAGHLAIKKSIKRRDSEGKSPSVAYYFDIKKCQQCPHAEGCYKAGAKSKSYSVTINSELHKKQQKFQETKEFKDLARTRYKIEAKNSEIKNRHGYDVVSSSGFLGMDIQGGTTLFVANIKRILTLMGK